MGPRHLDRRGDPSGVQVRLAEVGVGAVQMESLDEGIVVSVREHDDRPLEAALTQTAPGSPNERAHLVGGQAALRGTA